jgi:hypothetical protein
LVNWVSHLALLLFHFLVELRVQKLDRWDIVGFLDWEVARLGCVVGAAEAGVVHGGVGMTHF